MVNDTTRLLGLERVAVVSVLDDTDGRPLVALDTANERGRIYRAVATRYDKLAVHFTATVIIAALDEWL